MGQAVILGDDASRDDAARAVCRAFVSSAPIDGVAFTEMDSDTVRNTWFASDEVAEELERIQYALGEGPTREAFRTRRPVLVQDVAAPMAAARWPVLAEQAGHLSVGGIFAVPMHLGAINVGVCLTYRRAAGPLAEQDLRDLLQAVDAATLALLAVRAGTNRPGPEDSPLSRGIHQATGMVVVQLRTSAERAFARIRAHAFLTGKSLNEVADDIVGRRLRLEADPPDAEPPSTEQE
jgi:hypothetical protein